MPHDTIVSDFLPPFVMISTCPHCHKEIKPEKVFVPSLKKWVEKFRPSYLTNVCTDWDCELTEAEVMDMFNPTCHD